VINRQSFGWTLTASPQWRGVLILAVTVPLAALLAALLPAQRLSQLDAAIVLRGE
jgi:ABC-type lipoprotein release transport system permease subunit